MRTSILVLAHLLALAPAFANVLPPADPTRYPAERRVIAKSYAPPASGPIRVAFFDADSTLRVAPSGKVSANSLTDVAVLPLVAKGLLQAEKDGYFIAIASNQGGVQAGFITLEIAQGALVYTCSQLSRLGTTVHWIDFAEGDGEDRKPDIGMAKRVAATLKEKYGREVDWKNSMMVGDSGWSKKNGETDYDGNPGEDISNSDRLFAEKAASVFGHVKPEEMAHREFFKFYHPKDQFHWKRYGVKNFENFKFLQGFVKDHPDLDPGVN
jgi:DNA 3'-phosphatase